MLFTRSRSHFGRNEVIVEAYRKRTQEQSEETLTLREFIKVCATVHA